MKYFEISTNNACSAHEYHKEFLSPPNNKMNIIQWKKFTLRENLPYTNGLIISSNKELTDIIKSSHFFMAGLILSNKALEVFTEFNIMEYRVIPIELTYKKDLIKDYNWITFRDSKLNSIDTYNYIDLNESMFKHLIEYNGRYPINNPTDYLNAWKSTATYRSERYKNNWDVYFYKNHLYDLIDMNCSEFLKKAIEENDLTGFSFNELGYKFHESNMEMPIEIVNEINYKSIQLRKDLREKYRKSMQMFSFGKLEDLDENVVFVDEHDSPIARPSDQKYFDQRFIAKGTKRNYFIRIPENIEYNKLNYKDKKEAFVEWYFKRQNPEDPNFSELFTF